MQRQVLNPPITKPVKNGAVAESGVTAGEKIQANAAS